MNPLSVNPKVVPFNDASRLLVEEDVRRQVAFAAAQAVDYSGPLLVLSEQRLRDNARRFIRAMPRVRPHFAVKANPDAAILKVFFEEGAEFEIASSAELDALLKLGVRARDVFYSNPIKSPTALKYAAAKGVQWYSLDSVDELQKIAAIAPQAKLYIRIEVSNEGSSWPLAGKFGASPAVVDTIIAAAKELQVDLCGVTFHVGSQCCNTENWVEGIKSAKAIFEKLTGNGFTPQLLNLGGGYPIQFTGTEPTIEEISLAISAELASLPESIQVMAEPGRYFVGSAACLVSQVVGTASRDQARWLYLDTGYYGGLMELVQGFPLKLVSERTGAAELWALAGPTCDSIDVLGSHYLPNNMQAEDLVFFPNLGAYSSSCACDFNGFPAPKLVVVD